MNVHQIMQCYQKTIDYYKEPLMDYLLSVNFDYTDRSCLNKIFYAFIEMCQFQDLFIPMVNRVKADEIIKNIIENNEKKWKRILNLAIKEANNA